MAAGELWLYGVVVGCSLLVVGWGYYQHRRLNQYIRERAEIEKHLLNQVRIDFLTGLYNRAGLDELLVREIARARRHHRPLSIILLDIDRLKSINDQFGHPVGDEVIRLVGQVLRSSLRITDIAARYGGDEFVIILPETSLVGAHAVIEKIRDRITAESLRRNLPVDISVSMGAAEGDDLRSLLHAADATMYRSKKGDDARAPSNG